MVVIGDKCVVCKQPATCLARWPEHEATDKLEVWQPSCDNCKPTVLDWIRALPVTMKGAESRSTDTISLQGVCLRRVGDFAIVEVQTADGEHVEVIREHVESNFDHHVSASGIRESKETELVHESR